MTTEVKSNKKEDKFIEEPITLSEMDQQKKRPIINGFLFLGKAFWSQWRVLLSVTIIFSAIIFGISLLTWGFDWVTPGDNFNISSGISVATGHSHHLNFFESLWWVFITISTIGYGDIYPVTTTMKLWAMFIGVVGIVFVSLYTAIVVNGFSIEMQRNLDMRRQKRDDFNRKHEYQAVTKELRKQLKSKEQEVDELMFAIATFSGKSEAEIQQLLKEARLNVKKELVQNKTKTNDKK